MMLAFSIGTAILFYLFGLLSAIFIGIWMFFYSRIEDRRKKVNDPNFQMYPDLDGTNSNDNRDNS